MLCKRIDGVMVSMLTSSAVNRGFEPGSGQAMKLVLGASLLSKQYEGVRAKIG